jgi:hypothetical protein
VRCRATDAQRAVRVEAHAAERRNGLEIDEGAEMRQAHLHHLQQLGSTRIPRRIAAGIGVRFERRLHRSRTNEGKSGNHPRTWCIGHLLKPGTALPGPQIVDIAG